MLIKLRRLLLWLTIAAAAVSIAGCGGQTPQSGGASDGGLTVHFIDVGQADAALVMCGGESMLIDGGNVQDSSTVVTYLRKQGVDGLDYVVCTHGHEDHVGGLAGALSAFTAGRVVSSCTEYDSKAFRDFEKYAQKQGRQIAVPAAGDTWSLGGAQVTVLGPLQTHEEENDNSVVLRIVYGSTSFLFTGDAELPAEQDMLESRVALASTVLKVGHHGSSTSSSYRFLNEVMPEYAVISVGKDNSYGHPHDEVLSRLRDADVQVYRTDLQGDVIAHSDGETVVFETKKAASAAQLNPTAAEKAPRRVGVHRQ